MRFECECGVCVDFIVCCVYNVIFCLSGCNHAMWGHAMITDVKLYICQAASSTQWGFFDVYNTAMSLVKHVAIRLIVIKMGKATATEYNEDFFFFFYSPSLIFVGVFGCRWTIKAYTPKWPKVFHLCETFVSRSCKQNIILAFANPLKMLFNMYKLCSMSLSLSTFNTLLFLSVYRSLKNVARTSIWQRFFICTRWILH